MQKQMAHGGPRHHLVSIAKKNGIPRHQVSRTLVSQSNAMWDKSDKTIQETVVGVEDDEVVENLTSYIGVTHVPEEKFKKWHTELQIGGTDGEEGKVIDGGLHWTAEDAARAYDELARMYLGSSEAVLNFDDAGDNSSTMPSMDQEVDLSIWHDPSDTVKPNPIPLRMGEHLTIDEVIHALEEDKAIDVEYIDLAGKSSLADFMVFATGRSKGHMQKIADTIFDAIRLRECDDDFEYRIEGRSSDDWMIVDANTIIVHVMMPEIRERLNLEDHWKHMKDDQSTKYNNMTEDEMLEKTPVEYINAERDFDGLINEDDEGVDIKNL